MTGDGGMWGGRTGTHTDVFELNYFISHDYLRLMNVSYLYLHRFGSCWRWTVIALMVVLAVVPQQVKQLGWEQAELLSPCSVYRCLFFCKPVLLWLSCSACWCFSFVGGHTWFLWLCLNVCIKTVSIKFSLICGHILLFFHCMTEKIIFI